MASSRARWRSADALIALAVPAIVGHHDQPEVGADLRAIVEGAIEHFIDQPLPADRADALELSEAHGLFFRRARGRGALLGPAVGFQDGQLLVHQAQPFVLACSGSSSPSPATSRRTSTSLMQCTPWHTRPWWGRQCDRASTS
jgi:hypothetical protein